jgi:hypothetical protein
MNPPPVTRHSSLAAPLALAVALLTASAAAQVMNDPTRPPSSHATSDPDAAGDAEAAARCCSR